MVALRNAALVVGALLFSAQPAFAQDGALWRDELGRQMEVGFAGGNSPAPNPVSWPATGMVELFSQICLDTSGEPAAVKSASAAAGFADKSYDMPVGKKKDPWPLVIATGRGVVVSQAERFLSNELRQCNLTFYLTETGNLQAIESALSDRLGRTPDNDAKRLRKNGKPNRYFTPEWIHSGQDGQSFKIIASPQAQGQGFQFSLLATKDGNK